jgi:predicted transcriptional regulator with HTH domain
VFLLLSSKLRRKLLTYSFTHPDGKYYVRELSHLINEDPGNLSRELKRLEGEGVYTSMIKGGGEIFFSQQEASPF